MGSLSQILLTGVKQIVALISIKSTPLYLIEGLLEGYTGINIDCVGAIQRALSLWWRCSEWYELAHRARAAGIAGWCILQWMSVRGLLALYDRIKSLMIRPLCVILHSLRHDLILVLGPGQSLACSHNTRRCQPCPDGHPNQIESHLEP